MDISQIGNGNSAGQAAMAKQLQKNSMDKQAFLELLVTQLRHQDPMDPLKQEEYAAQLAQFSQVEQLTNLNEKLEQMYGSNMQLNRSISNMMATTLVGKKARAQGNSIRYSAADPMELSYQLTQPASDATITIRDGNGQAVRTEALGYQDAGEGEFHWDGLYDNGARAVDGATYTYEVTATDANGEAVDVYSFIQGTISGVEYGSDGQMYFLMGNHRVSAGDVQRIYDGG